MKERIIIKYGFYRTIRIQYQRKYFGIWLVVDNVNIEQPYYNDLTNEEFFLYRIKNAVVKFCLKYDCDNVVNKTNFNI